MISKSSKVESASIISFTNGNILPASFNTGMTTLTAGKGAACVPGLLREDISRHHTVTGFIHVSPHLAKYLSI